MMSEPIGGPGAARPARRPKRAGIGSVLFRQLPRVTPVHRMWVGTKLIALAALTFAVLLNPGWSQVGALAALTAVTVAAARVPLTAWPRIPVWFWLLVLVGFLLARVGGGTEQYLTVVALTALFLALSAVVMWTSAMDDLAPALAVFARPLRPLRVPVDEWAVATALCVRSLPLVVDEMRTLIAAKRLRPNQRVTSPSAVVRSAVDLLTGSIAVAMRRASDMGEAITARGGTGQLTAHPVQAGWRDAVALVVTAIACLVPIWLP
jgi:energy-coupling factor transport system permease protein